MMRPVYVQRLSEVMDEHFFYGAFIDAVDREMQHRCSKTAKRQYTQQGFGVNGAVSVADHDGCIIMRQRIDKNSGTFLRERMVTEQGNG